jgi:hypothetical protein
MTSARLKLQRAKLHLDALNAEVDSADRGGLYGMVCEPDAQPGHYLIKAVKTGAEETWALIIGDYLHNLRSVLDHIVWQLVVANGGTPTNDTKFPVAESGPDWFDREAAKRQLKGVHPQAVAAIRTLQPFPPHYDGEPKLSPLWLLQKLNNIDKHRLIHTVTLSPHEARLTLFEPIGGGDVELFDLSGRMLEHGTPIARMRADMQPKIEPDSQLTTANLLDETEDTPRLEWGVLDLMFDAVSHAVRLLAQFVAWSPGR